MKGVSNGKLSIFSLKNKIIFGFAVMIAVIVAISAMAYRGFSRVDKSVEFAIKRNQPAIIGLLELSDKIDQVTSRLGVYLINPDAASRKKFNDAILEAEIAVYNVSKLPVIKENNKYAKVVKQIEKQ